MKQQFNAYYSSNIKYISAQDKIILIRKHHGIEPSRWSGTASHILEHNIIIKKDCIKTSCGFLLLLEGR
jgi:hypothetical protein